MQNINIIYPIESGLIWLEQRAGTYGGWRGDFNAGSWSLRKVAVVECLQNGSPTRYHFFFFIPGELEESCRLKFLGRLNGSGPGQFNYWGLPLEKMDEIEKRYLPELLSEDLTILATEGEVEPLFFTELEAQAA